MSGSAAARALPPCPHCGQEHPDTALKCPDTDLVLPLRGRLLDGKFRLLRPLGTGGMASVWLALNIHVDRQVAIKIIRPEVARSESMVARFRSEARAAGRIGHPNICDILDFGVGPVGPYIVMEHLQGRSLAELLNKEKRLDAPRAVAIVREALSGLSAAHEQGIVHRDLKPENMFLHRPSVGDPVVKLMDFGVAKFTDGTGEVRTEHGALLGTPEYMAPEQFKGAAHADHRSDIWAVGAILYRSLTGKNPFGGPTVAATLLAVTHDPPRPIAELAPEVPKALADIVLRCLAKNPAERYASVAELDAALEPFHTDSVDVDLFAAPSAEDTDADMAGPTVAARNVPPVVPLDTTRPYPIAAPRSRSWKSWAAVVAVGIVVGGAYRMFGVPAHEGGTSQTEEPTVASSDREGEHEQEPSASPTPPHEVSARIEPDASSLTSAPKPEAEGDSATEEPIVIAETPAAEDLAIAPRGDDGSDPTEAGPTEDPNPSDPVGPSTSPPPTQTTPTEPPPPDPPGVIRAGPYVTLDRTTPRSNHGDARRYCESLGEQNHLGISRWQLANPSTVKSFKGVRGVRKGDYWTSARWRGRVIVISLPSTKKSSVAAEKKSPRPFCVARWP